MVLIPLPVLAPSTHGVIRGRSHKNYRDSLFQVRRLRLDSLRQPQSGCAGSSLMATAAEDKASRSRVRQNLCHGKRTLGQPDACSERAFMAISMRCSTGSKQQEMRVIGDFHLLRYYFSVCFCACGWWAELRSASPGALFTSCLWSPSLHSSFISFAVEADPIRRLTADGTVSPVTGERIDPAQMSKLLRG